MVSCQRKGGAMKDKSTKLLDASKVYPVTITADDDGVTASIDIGVWVDASTASPDGDGGCP